MIKAIIIDDEFSARKIVRNLLLSSKHEFVIVGEADSVESAVHIIKEKQPEVVFLDIEMPFESGLTLFDKVDIKNAQIIFISAHSEYAIDAIKHAALDYILKPISPTEFYTAVDNALSNIHTKDKVLHTKLELLNNYLSHQQNDKLAINTMEGLDIIPKQEILYLHANTNYTWIHTKTRGQLLTSKTLKEFEEILREPQFVRVYRSSIINLDYVTKYINGRGGQVKMLDGELINVSRDKKSDLIYFLKNL